MPEELWEITFDRLGDSLLRLRRIPVERETDHQYVLGSAVGRDRVLKSLVDRAPDFYRPAVGRFFTTKERAIGAWINYLEEQKREIAAKLSVLKREAGL